MVSDPSKPVRALETGASDGMSMNLMLDELFPHPESEIHGMDLYDGDAGNKLREDFEANAKIGGHAGRLHHYEGTSREVMAWMIAGENFWENFDFIHLNSAGDASQMLGDASQAWSLLKPGGILAFSGSIAARPGVEAFLAVHEKLADRLFVGRRVVLRKRV